MIKLRITKKAQKKLGVYKSDEEIRIDRFDTWHVNNFNDSRRTGLIFMNDLTRFCVIIFGLRKSDGENLLEIFKNQLRINLIRIGVDELKTRRYISEIDSYVVDDTNNRSVIGSITDCLKMLPSWTYGEDCSDSEYVSYINEKFNGMPMFPLSKDGFEPFPDKAMKEVLYAEKQEEKNVT